MERVSVFESVKPQRARFPSAKEVVSVGTIVGIGL